MEKTFLQLTSPAELPFSLKGGVVAIGNFDGVHRGHQAVLEEALLQAKAKGSPAHVLTFEPHPRAFFNPSQPLDRLTSLSEKAELIRLMGFDSIIVQNFTRDFAGLAADQFIRDILIGQMGVHAVVTGYNFHFGAKRSGTPQTLKEKGDEYGFSVTLVEPFCDENGEVISSSRIRNLLGQGCIGEAAGLLGYRYAIKAPIIHGEKLGRTLGFPTANMMVPQATGLRYGVYAVKFRLMDGQLYNGVASFGRRPTVNEVDHPLLETYLFDFDGNLYDQNCRVSFFSYLRGEEKFDGLDPLIAQIKLDCAQAKAFMEKVEPLSFLDRHYTF